MTQPILSLQSALDRDPRSLGYSPADSSIIPLARRFLRGLLPEEQALDPRELDARLPDILRRQMPTLRYSSRRQYQGRLRALLRRLCAPGDPRKDQERALSLLAACAEKNAGRPQVARALLHVRRRCEVRDIPQGASAQTICDLLAQDAEKILRRGGELAPSSCKTYSILASHALRAHKATLEEPPQDPIPQWREFPLRRPNGHAGDGILFQLPLGGIRVSEITAFYLSLLPLAEDYEEVQGRSITSVYSS